MNRAGIRLCILATAGALACGDPADPEDTPAAQSGAGGRGPAEGYTLLYDTVSQQQYSDELLLVKLESDALDAVISELAEVADQYETTLSKLAENDPDIDLAPFSPVLSRMQQSIRDEQQSLLLDASGAEFERALLRAQSEGASQMLHLARAMQVLEPDPEKRKFWTDVEQRYAGLREKIERLLEERHFCDH